MRIPFRRLLATAVLPLCALPAGAAFHLWALDEIYSNADRSVQYVELQAFSGGQQFLAGHTLVAGTGPTARTFTFPSDLPGDTAAKRMLIGTASFAALGLVAPDYVVPDGFFDAPGGTLSFAEGFDVWTYANVPMDGGVIALFRSGSAAVRSPTNFAGQVPDPPRLANISTRMQVLTGADVMIGGFVVGGGAPKTIVVRARGPSLQANGIVGFLANPQLQLFSGQVQIGVNDDWIAAGNAAQLLTSGFAPGPAEEAAILITLSPGAYTAIVTGVGQATGVAIVEVFEVGGAEIPLVNISTRGRVQAGDNVMIGGFVIQGGAQQVVVRARGPSLAAQGVPDTLANPTLQLFAGSTPIATNDNWGDATNAAAIQAAGFHPSQASEAAIMTTLGPGAYTAIVSGVGNTTGVAIVEVFRVP